MFPRSVFGWLAVLMLSATADIATAQQFRVYTRVTQMRPGQSLPPTDQDVIARSLTLFHAGRVFDWLPAVGEVTVFEPSHERFILYNGRRKMATTVSFAEIQRVLDSARDETRSYVQRLEERGTVDAGSVTNPLRFQLAPVFEEKFDAGQQHLSLTSPRFRYEVTCGDPLTPQATTAYLNYADWAARLNYVLHPRSLYPEPRLKLNTSLREHQRIPLSVVLRVDFDQPLVLSADHRFAWQLEEQDRQHITHWEQQLRDNSLEWVAFRDYQQAILGTEKQARR